MQDQMKRSHNLAGSEACRKFVMLQGLRKLKSSISTSLCRSSGFFHKAVRKRTASMTQKFEEILNFP
ncbi:hypothetical protein NL676_010275 [Syzygium grande]|nr:hypothetical protein NL676_010275 [Syzygium grande]